jgi:protease I
MPQILIVTGDAGESYEALYAVHRFREEEWRVAVAAPSVRRLHLVMHDFEPGWDTYVERPGYGLQADLSFSEVKVRDYDAILILGGRAPEYLRNDRRLLELVREFDTQQKWIFAICHGIQVFAAAGLTNDKCITCYEHVRFEAEQAGGRFVAQQAVPRRSHRHRANLAISSRVLSRDLCLLCATAPCHSILKSRHFSNHSKVRPPIISRYRRYA